MNSSGAERRLAAVLAADVVGYSRLMGADEEGTHAALQHCLGEVINPKIDEHHGRIVKTTGDGLLVEYPSVLNAVRCAVEIQTDLADYNSDRSADKRLLFRIGVNLGDIILDKDDIFGDGVNVAARLESLGEPGGICISESVRTAVGTRLSLDYEFMGEQEVKNIAAPVRVYRVSGDAGEALKTTSPEKPALELPDKPSIAVLPFENMSGDPEQEYFSDGITEDIITDLSRVSGLFVIARNSTFTFKGKPVMVQEVSKNLGVRYVVEGSVRKAGNSVRVTAQLLDGITGGAPMGRSL